MGGRRVTTVTENMPPVIGLPIALELSGVMTPVLALAVPSTVERGQVDEFLMRHGFAARGDTALARTSRTRWSVETNGRLVFSFYSPEMAGRFEMPNEPGFAISTGGTVGVMTLPNMDEPTAAAVARRTETNGGEYWLLGARFEV